MPTVTTMRPSGERSSAGDASGGGRQQEARGEGGVPRHGVTFSSSADAASTSAASSWSTRATRAISLSASG